MFTGLIETIGSVRRLDRRTAGARLEVTADWPDGVLPEVGDSIAVNGACLTVLEPTADGFAADLSPETLARTLLGETRTGESVNLERALRLGDRLGGHLVQGHVDAVVRVLGIRQQGGFATWTLNLPAELRHEVARKGSVCVHGVSLTVAALAEDSFTLALIPETLAATVLGGLRQGARLHLETDVLAKYVARRMGADRPTAIHTIFGDGSGSA